MPFNFETNEEFIEARYIAGTNQYDLELMAAAPDIVDFGAGSSSSDGGLIQSELISLGPNRRDPGCPRLDQFVKVLDANGELFLKKVEFINIGDLLWNSVNCRASEVVRREIKLRERCYRITTAGGSVVASETQPLIRQTMDENGIIIKHLSKKTRLFAANERKPYPLVSRVFVGNFDCLSISLEADCPFYDCGETDAMLVLHNVKAFNENEPEV